MTLREQFLKEVTEKYKGNAMTILFESSAQHYIDWLENKIKQFQNAQSKA